MEFKSELANAVKLFILLILLFWSFTWNSDPNLDFSEPKSRKADASKFLKDTSSAKSDASVWTQQASVLIKTFSTVPHNSIKPSKTVSTSGGILPSFNEWKEIERMKYENLSSKNDTVSHPKKTSQRKLNYASEKCGAKILASNPEARHRIAILNEKPDEYMLNPCRVKMWFVIELCDTVEATQVDLANYELFSSSPREFSVFWSKVFPTPVWHLLGTFEAKDQRTMQTFRVNSKNLGKFIKVILYSHHGKEHYCLLSVIRVLGYSMVEKLEDIEESNSLSHLDNQPGMQFDKNLTIENKHNSKETIKIEFFKHLDEFSVKICALFLKHCSEDTRENFVKSCSNKPVCRFFSKLFHKHLRNCNKSSSSTVNKTPLKSSNTTQSGEQRGNKNLTNNIFLLNMKTQNENAKKVTRSAFDDIAKDYKFDKRKENLNTIIKWNMSVSENITDTKRSHKRENNGIVHEAFKEHTSNNYEEKCTCEKGKTVQKISRGNKDSDTVKESKQDLSIFETDVDSAGLIQKESVLFKLTTRIRASEIELDLINKYLQQLSQSYRQQMEDMQVMFNRTMKAINAASEKAALIDQKQQKSINSLQKNIMSLTGKVDYLMNGQRDLMKRVIEMHAFFLILEIIIISTIFTIFMNIFHQKKTLMKQEFLDKEATRVEEIFSL